MIPFKKIPILAALLGALGPLYATHDQNIANADGATVRADINSALAALFSLSSNATAPSTTIAYQLWADTTSALLKQRNAANTGWIVRGTLAETFVTSRSSNTILAAADFAKFFRATSGFTQTLTAAATLGDGWFCFYRVESGVTLTIDPNSTEQIDGAATKDFVGPCSGIIACSGSAFFSYGFDFPMATQAIQEAASSAAYAVSPAVQHFHPSAVKFFVSAGADGSTAITYNVTSITDAGVGLLDVTIANDFSTTNWVPWGLPIAAINIIGRAQSIAAGSCSLQYKDYAGTLADPDRFNVGGFGDL